MTTLDAWVAEQRAANPLYPWPLTDDGRGVAWPVSAERPRLKRYALMEQAYDQSQHFDLYEAHKFTRESERNLARSRYISSGLVKTAIRFVVRILAAEDPTVMNGGPAVQEIADRSGIGELARALLRDRLRLGDCAILVNSIASSEDGARTVWLEQHDVEIAYPVAREGTRREVESVRIVRDGPEFAVSGQDGDHQYVYIISHEPYAVTHTLWELVEGALVGPVEFDRCPYAAALSGGAGQSEVRVEHDVDEPLIAWCPRHAETGLWGDALCADALEPLGIINRRETQRDTVLTAHDDPIMVVHIGDTVQELDSQGEPTGGLEFRLSQSHVLVRESNSNIPPPQFVQSNPHLEANERAQESALRSFATLSGISVASITQQPDGITPESGTALRMRHRETVETATEEARAICVALGDALRRATWLETGADPGAIEVAWEIGGEFAIEDPLGLAFAPTAMADQAALAEDLALEDEADGMSADDIAAGTTP